MKISAIYSKSNDVEARDDGASDNETILEENPGPSADTGNTIIKTVNTISLP